MSFRELRNFCEIMRSLGFSKIISMENFKLPNFKLVAEILYWFIHRFDPKADVPDDIEDEKERIEFIIISSKFFYTHLKIKINLKKLYASDNNCIHELLKIAQVFYNAKNSSSDTMYLNNNDIDNVTTELDITSKTKELSDLKDNSGSIVESGLMLIDMLEKEKINKSSRDKAIEFLNNLTNNSDYDNKKEKEQIEKRIISILQSQEDTLEQLDTHINQLKQKEASLDEELKSKQADLKRLQGIISTSDPKQDEDQLNLENEMHQIYSLYVDKLRNNDYLEHKLEECNEVIKYTQEIADRKLNVIIDIEDNDDKKDFYDKHLNIEMNNNNSKNLNNSNNLSNLPKNKEKENFNSRDNPNKETYQNNFEEEDDDNENEFEEENEEQNEDYDSDGAF